MQHPSSRNILIALDQYQLSLLQDLPYLGIYHKDSKQQIRELGNELNEIKQGVGESVIRIDLLCRLTYSLSQNYPSIDDNTT